MTTVYTRHPDLRLTTIAQEGVVLHLGSRQYFSVNETGVTILNALEQPRTLPELVTALTDEYEVTDELAEVTVREFLNRCRDADLLRAEER
ncbi:MAG: PqqD family protein [bacterium]